MSLVIWWSLTGVFLIVLQLLGSPLSPNKPVDITFPRTAESTIELVDAYGAEGQREYNWYEAVDLIFIVVYGTTLYLSFQTLATNAYARCTLQALVFITCAADYFEDGDALLLNNVMPFLSEDVVAEISVVAVSLKNAGLFVCFTAVIILAIASRCNKNGYDALRS
ncbi:unnamed protein product [Durusdinium trenchii]|uniref:Uncharacterized protein n=1 Tax=Durusdinium trenchii TaxID=1381693 RepID=A0ABP0M6E8_9DINO